MELNVYFQKHIFFCYNNKANQNGCGDVISDEPVQYVKSYLQALDQWGEGKS